MTNPKPYDVPVLVIRFLPPATDGTHIHPVVGADWASGRTINSVKTLLNTFTQQVAYAETEGSRFHGYKNPQAPNALNYQVVKTVDIAAPLPASSLFIPSGGDPYNETEGQNGRYLIDYTQVLSASATGYTSVAAMIEELAIKEVWIWSYDTSLRGWESMMVPATTTPLSADNGGERMALPRASHTYIIYSYNMTRTAAQAIHNHSHQLESQLRAISQAFDKDHSFWSDTYNSAFTGVWSAPDVRADEGGDTHVFRTTSSCRCGNCHLPPNARYEYDYANLGVVQSDIENWHPKGGTTTSVSCLNWRNAPYAWPDGVVPDERDESHWHIYWRQNFPGRGNAVAQNWWDILGDWDGATERQQGLLLPESLAWAYLCFDILSDGSIDPDGPLIEPTCTDAKCAIDNMPPGTRFRVITRPVSPFGPPLTSLQITDASHNTRLGTNRDANPSLCMRVDSDAPASDLSTYTQLVNYNRLTLPKAPAHHKVEIVVLIPPSLHPLQQNELPILQRRS